MGNGFNFRGLVCVLCHCLLCHRFINYQTSILYRVVYMFMLGMAMYVGCGCTLTSIEEWVKAVKAQFMAKSV